MAKRLEGLHTVKSIAEALDVDRRTAVNYVSELRKRGYLKTSRGRGKIRLYKISGTKIAGESGTDLYGFINRYSKEKIYGPYEHIIHGKMTAELAIVKAIETREFRTILAAMHLFRLVKNWAEFNRLAKIAGVQRKAGALYDLTRKFMKVSRMDKRTRNSLMAAPSERFVIEPMKSRDFREIEKAWHIHLPFNKDDMRRFA